MLFTGASAIKHIKYLEGEKAALLMKEQNNSFITEFDGKDTTVGAYSFKETREKIAAIDKEIAIIKHRVNLFNTTTEVKIGLTIDSALLKLAQLNKELSIVESMKDRPKEEVEARYSGQVVKKVNYDLEEVARYHRGLIKEIHTLQMQIDMSNLTKTFEIEEL